MLEDIRRDIRMLGVNINQIAKARNAIQKSSLTFDEYMALIESAPAISKDDITILSRRFDEVIKKVGDLNHVHKNKP